MWITFVGVGPAELTSRRLAVVAPLSSSKIAILGGISGREMRRDILIVDINENSTKLMQEDCGKDFTTDLDKNLGKEFKGFYSRSSAT